MLPGLLGSKIRLICVRTKELFGGRQHRGLIDIYFAFRNLIDIVNFLEKKNASKK